MACKKVDQKADHSADEKDFRSVDHLAHRKVSRSADHLVDKKVARSVREKVSHLASRLDVRLGIKARQKA